MYFLASWLQLPAFDQKLLFRRWLLLTALSPPSSYRKPEMIKTQLPHAINLPLLLIGFATERVTCWVSEDSHREDFSLKNELKLCDFSVMHVWDDFGNLPYDLHQPQLPLDTWLRTARWSPDCPHYRQQKDTSRGWLWLSYSTVFISTTPLTKQWYYSKKVAIKKSHLNA